MKRLHLSGREQLLSALVVMVIVLGSYVLLRFIPVTQAIGALRASAEATEQRLFNTRIPEEPVEDLDRMSKELENLERAMEQTRSQAEAMESRLSSMDARELIVRISQLAQENRVQIRSNDEYRQTAAQPAAPNRPSSHTPRKNQAKAKPAGSGTAQSFLPARNRWIDRMGPDTLLHRPMRHLVLEGSFTAIHQFIFGLAELPYQVTVLRLSIEKSVVLSPPGYAQILVADLILAL